MYKYLVAFVLLTPLIGIWMVETGEHAAAIGVDGYPNGAAFAYAGYAAVVAAVAWLCRGTRVMVRNRATRSQEIDKQLRMFGKNLLILSSIFLVVFLFGFGAINVWTGDIGKGQFRVGLGQLGAIPNLMTKFILPALLAYFAALYRRSSRRADLRRLLAANFIVIFVIGASWGFKSTAVMMLVPALLMLYWKVSIRTLLQGTLVLVICLAIFFYLFDASVEENAQVHTYLFNRITVRQGDLAWYIWDQYVSGEKFPNYWPTLLAALGDKVLTFFGLSRDNFSEWAMYHYDYMLTYLAGVSPEQIEEGHSLTATPFAEGLVAGGMYGVALFALLGGVLVGRLHWFIGRSLGRGDDAYAALGATYFCFYVFGWLNGGAVVQLFHISVWVSVGVTLIAFKLMRGQRVFSGHQLAAG